MKEDLNDIHNIEQLSEEEVSYTDLTEATGDGIGLDSSEQEPVLMERRDHSTWIH